MTWLNAAAFAGFAFIAIPVLVHLLARRNARVQPFPSLRFIGDARVVAPSRAVLSDAVLLAIRVGIVALAAAALAGPLWLTEARRTELSRTTARAIIVDTSASMRRLSDSGVTALEAARQAAAEAASGVAMHHIVSTDDPVAQLYGAVGWLAATRVARRELVIVSDFQVGMIDPRDLAGLPAAIGVQLVRIPVDTAVAAVPAPPAARGARTVADTANADDGIRVLGPDGDGATTAATLRVALAGLGAPRVAGRPVAVVFPGYPLLDSLLGAATASLEPWMADVAWRLRHDSLRALRMARNGVGELLLVSNAVAGTLDAALLLRETALAIQPLPSPGEAEPAVLGDSALLALQRDAVDGEGAPAIGSAGASDARWFWIAALVLLLVEALVRRRVRVRDAATGDARA